VQKTPIFCWLFNCKNVHNHKQKKTITTLHLGHHHHPIAQRECKEFNFSLEQKTSTLSKPLYNLHDYHSTNHPWQDNDERWEHKQMLERHMLNDVMQ